MGNRNNTDTKVTIITTCKSRLKFLSSYLPTWLSQETPFEFRIRVVDYDCPENTFGWCQSIEHPNAYRMEAIKVPDRPEFNLSHARNCGSRPIVTPLIFFLDADVELLDPSWLAQAAEPLLRDQYAATVVGDSSGSLGRGQIGMKFEVFEELNGFDEAMSGWGYEDTDFLTRLERKYPVADAPGSPKIAVRPHEDTLRSTHYSNKDIKASWKRNKAISEDLEREINPLGYGVAQIQLWNVAT